MGNWTKEYSLMDKADAETFVTIRHDLNIELGKDKDYVFLLQFGGTNCIINGAEPESFYVFNGYLWSKDINHVFYMFDLLDTVKANEFEAINENWGKSKSSYYYHHLRIDSLDYETAEIVNTYFMNEEGKHSDYIKDNNHVFFQNRLVKDANPKTFIADGVVSFGHDDKYMFDWEENEGSITEKYRKIYIDKKSQHLSRGKVNKGFRSFRALSPASIYVVIW